MDSTLIQNEGIDELAREMGVYKQVAELTEQAMQGKLPFKESLPLRLKLLKGLTQAQIDAVKSRIKLTKGARELIQTLKKQGHLTAIISGGFDVLALPLQKELQIDFLAINQLKLKNGVFDGNCLEPIIDTQAKADSLIHFAKNAGIDLENTVAIGDGSNDAQMLKASGFGIAFCAKPKLKPFAKLCIDSPDLSEIIRLL